jgi:LytS/YehU family sensor histidine kinase
MVRGDPAQAEPALEGLGDLLRYALRVHRDGLDRTSLRREREFMETYLGLEKIRLGDRLQVELRAGPAAMDSVVPTFSLQPLVENAVRHGIAPRAAGGRINVEARIDGDALRLEVRDDGDKAGCGGTDEDGGTGLRVLRERLEVLYQGKARITAGPGGAGGYRVELVLPAAPPAREADA